MIEGRGWVSNILKEWPWKLVTPGFKGGKFSIDVLSPFISILCHSDSLFHRESCPRLDVVYPGRVWSSSPACTWHCSLNYFFLQTIPLFPHGVTICYSFLALTMSSSSLFTPALLRTHSFVFFAVHETRRIFLSPFITNALRRVSPFFLSVQLLQPNMTTGHTSAFISLVFIEIGMLWFFHIFCSDAPIAYPLLNLVRNCVVHSPSSVIRDPKYGNVFTCANCSFWMSMLHGTLLLVMVL